MQNDGDAHESELPIGFAAGLTAVGAVQLDPLKVIALPTVSITAQKLVVGHDTRRLMRSPALPELTSSVAVFATGSITWGADHVEPL